MTTKKPVIDVDPTKIPAAAEGVGDAVKPFIPAKVRTVVYTVGAAAAAACMAVSPALGGQVGDVLGVIGAAVAAGVGTLAVSHISK